MFTLHNTWVIILLVMLTVSNGCDRCKQSVDCSAANSDAIPWEMKSFFYFKQGSWWVYRNEAQNKYDTLWTFESRTDFLSGDDEVAAAGQCYEMARAVICNSQVNKIFNVNITSVSTRQIRHARFHEIHAGSDFILNYENDELQTSEVDGVRRLDSLRVQNRTYYGIIEAKPASSLPDRIKYHAFARGIGLIRYVDKYSNQWDLVQHLVFQ